jgi:hypothetical protein
MERTLMENACTRWNNDSLLISAISIFLNFQTYHHLLPGISHFHFLDKTFVSVINEFLEESGEKVEISTFGKVVKGYFQYMARLQSDEHFKTRQSNCYKQRDLCPPLKGIFQKVASNA